MALIDEYKNGKRYGPDWKAPSIQHMNDLVGTVVIAEDNAANAKADSLTAKEQSTQALNIANSANTKSDSAVGTANAANTKAEQAANTSNNADIKSTEALNKSSAAETNSSEALRKAGIAETNSADALNKSTIAEANSVSAVNTANGAKTTAEGIDGKAQQALDNSNTALNKASTALEQVTQSLGSKLYANGTLINEVQIAQELGDSEITLISQKALTEAINSKLDADTYLYLDINNPPDGYAACKCDGVTDDRAAFELLMNAAIAKDKTLRQSKGILRMNCETPFTIPDNLRFVMEEGTTLSFFQNTPTDVAQIFLNDTTNNSYLRLESVVVERGAQNRSFLYGTFSGVSNTFIVKSFEQQVSTKGSSYYWYGVMYINNKAPAASNTIIFGDITLTSGTYCPCTYGILGGSSGDNSAYEPLPMHISIEGEIDLSNFNPTSGTCYLLGYGQGALNIEPAITKALNNKTYTFNSPASIYFVGGVSVYNYNSPQIKNLTITQNGTGSITLLWYNRTSLSTIPASAAALKSCWFENVTIKSAAHVSFIYGSIQAASNSDSTITSNSYVFKNITVEALGTGSVGVRLVTQLLGDPSASQVTDWYYSNITIQDCTFKATGVMFFGDNSSDPAYTIGAKQLSAMPNIHGTGMQILNTKIRYLGKGPSAWSSNSFNCIIVRPKGGSSSASSKNYAQLYISRCDILIDYSAVTSPGSWNNLSLVSANNSVCFAKLNNVNIKLIKASDAPASYWGIEFDSPSIGQGYNEISNCQTQVGGAQNANFKYYNIAIGDNYNKLTNITSNISPAYYLYGDTDETNTYTNIRVDENLELDLWEE